MKMIGMVVMVCLFSVRLLFADDIVGSGNHVSLDYDLSVDGKIVESSVGNKPLEFVMGNKGVIPGLERGIYGMRIGEERIITVEPIDAYGQYDPAAIKDFPKSAMPADVKLGQVLQAKSPDGNSFPATIKGINNKTVTLDFNHPLSGKQLTFRVKVLAIDHVGVSNSQQTVKNVLGALGTLANIANNSQATVPQSYQYQQQRPSQYKQLSTNCVGYSGPGGPCSTGPGGGLSTGPGGGLSTGPGGGLSTGPGGGLSTGPGGGLSTGPGGGLSTGPGGGLSTGPGGGLSTGPGGGLSTGPGGGCSTGPGQHRGWYNPNNCK